MKHIYYSLFFLLLSFGANAQQAWELLPSGASATYQSLGNDRTVLMLQDSSISTNGTVRDHINLALRSSMGEGCDTSMVDGWPYQRLENHLLFDAYESHGDTHIIGDPEFDKAFKLPPPHQLDDISMFYDSLLLRRDSFEVRSIFGQSDSCVHYTILNDDSSTTDWWLVRSKSFGIIEGPSIRALYTALNSAAINHMYKLIGWKTETTSLGYEHPSFVDWFGFELGDQFLYKVVREQGLISTLGNCEGYVKLVVDSIAPSGHRYFKRSYYESNYLQSTERCGVFLNFDFQEMLLEPWASGMAACRDYSVFTPSVRLDSIGNDHLDFGMLAGQCDGLYIDAPAHSYELSSDIGMQSQVSGSWGDIERYTLVASQTSKGNFGVWPELLGFDGKKKESQALIVYPNPADDLLNIQGSIMNEPGVMLSLQTINGIECWSGNASIIDLSELSSGVYLLHVQSSLSDEWKRVIVQ